MQCKTFFHSENGQASIEAAFILPIALLCIGLALQPLLYMYSKSLCHQAAEEGVRYAMSEENNSRTERYILRRLSSIPSLPILHKGEEADWNIEIIRADNKVRISIMGHMAPLPLLGVPSKMFLPHDDDGLKIKTEAEGPISPGWREGTYDEWVDQFR